MADVCTVRTMNQRGARQVFSFHCEKETRNYSMVVCLRKGSSHQDIWGRAGYPHLLSQFRVGQLASLFGLGTLKTVKLKSSKELKI